MHGAAPEQVRAMRRSAVLCSAAAGVQPGEALLAFRDSRGFDAVESRNHEGWNLLHLAAAATLDTPEGMHDGILD